MTGLSFDVGCVFWVLFWSYDVVGSSMSDGRTLFFGFFWLFFAWVVFSLVACLTGLQVERARSMITDEKLTISVSWFPNWTSFVYGC